MSLLSTLAKVAVGVAVAKGVSGMASGKSGGAGGGSIFGGPMSPKGGQSSGGGFGDLGSILSGGGASGGLGGLLESLAGAGAGGSSSGGKSRTGGGLLDGLSDASRPSGGHVVPKPRGGSLGDMLNQSLDGFGEPETPPQREHEDAAKVMLIAMLQAAKSDGRIDADEKKNLLGKLGDVSRDEMAFIEDELQKPVDIKALARNVPAGMGPQVYSMSLLAIDLDNKKEAKYLHELASALNIEPRQANAIHEQMGEPKLYG